MKQTQNERRVIVKSQTLPEELQGEYILRDGCMVANLIAEIAVRQLKRDKVSQLGDRVLREAFALGSNSGELELSFQFPPALKESAYEVTIELPPESHTRWPSHH